MKTNFWTTRDNNTVADLVRDACRSPQRKKCRQGKWCRLSPSKNAESIEAFEKCEKYDFGVLTTGCVCSVRGRKNCWRKKGWCSILYSEKDAQSIKACERCKDFFAVITPFRKEVALKPILSHITPILDKIFEPIPGKKLMQFKEHNIDKVLDSIPNGWKRFKEVWKKSTVLEVMRLVKELDETLITDIERLKAIVLQFINK